MGRIKPEGKRPKARAIALVALAIGATLVAAPAQPRLESGLDLTAFDRSVRPQDDLYRFVNGGWIDRTELPAERAFYAAYTELSDKVDATCARSSRTSPKARRGARDRRRSRSSTCTRA